MPSSSNAGRSPPIFLPMGALRGPAGCVAVQAVPCADRLQDSCPARAAIRTRRHMGSARPQSRAAASACHDEQAALCIFAAQRMPCKEQRMLCGAAAQSV
jgi:hypothetical protein